ncbi:MAG: nitrile hydratase subunit alpha [Microcystis panniformis]
MEPKDPNQNANASQASAEEKTNKSRRNFLRNAGLASLSAGATTIVGKETIGDPVSGKSPVHEGVTPDDSRAMHGGAPVSDIPLKSTNGKLELVLPPIKERVLALKQLLIEKKLIQEQAIQGFVDYYEKFVGPHLGAAVVAHAWTNPDWKAQLLAPPPEKPFQAALLIRDFLFNTVNPDTGKPYLIPQLTFGLTIGPEGEFIRIVANGEQTHHGKTLFVHNLVTCTVCSCYPQALLGTQPMWYKSQQYRARSISDPFGILVEFAEDANRGTAERQAQFQAYANKLDELRVWDSNSEVRFFVIPEMPKQWIGLTENELRKRVTRNAMLGAEILYV